MIVLEHTAPGPVLAVAALESVTVPVACPPALTLVGEIVSPLKAGATGGVTFSVAFAVSCP